jgi:hypothetical protein
MSLQDKASIVWPLGAQTKAGNLAAWNPQDGTEVPIGVERAGPKTRVNEAGLIETVAANVLARDFTYGGCGDFTIEDERTNLNPNSEDFSTWGTSNASVTLNATTAPDGNLTADLLIGNTTSGRHGLLKSFGSSTTLNASFPIFVKAKELRYIQIASANTPNQYVNFDAQTGTIGNVGSEFTNIEVISLVDGWYRIESSTSGNRYTTVYINLVSSNTAGWLESWVMPNATDGLYIFGHQFEVADYSSSYMPTNGSTFTRLRDVPSLTGASALLGDSEGGLFLEVSVFTTDLVIISIDDGSSDNRVQFDTQFNNFRLLISTNANQSINSQGTPIADTFYKIGIAYNASGSDLYLNGSSLITETDDASFTSNVLTNITFGLFNGNKQFFGRIRQLVIFNQAPTDSQLAAITTP